MLLCDGATEGKEGRKGGYVSSNADVDGRPGLRGSIWMGRSKRMYLREFEEDIHGKG